MDLACTLSEWRGNRIGRECSSRAAGVRSMPRELITIQVGQCGNQVGCKFWEMALKEHAAANPADAPSVDKFLDEVVVRAFARVPGERRGDPWAGASN